MPEHDCLPADVSASDFVVHMGQMSGLPYTAARERAADVLRHVGLAEERYRPMGGYSTGMKQRVKLAQALVHDPRLVLLDEPTNGLDPSSRDDMLALVRRIGHEFGIAVLVTSHLLGELERVSDHVVVLDGGRLLRSSATTEFLHATGSLIVEVQGKPDADRLLGQALVEAGLAARPAGGALIEVEVRDDDHAATSSATSPSTSASAWCGCRSGTTASRTSSAREVPAVSSPSDAARLDGRPAGVIHDIGYRPYAGPRLGAGPVAWSFFAHRAAQHLRPRPVRPLQGAADDPARR